VDSIVILGDSIKGNFSSIIHKELNVVSIVNSINLSDSMKLEKKSFNNSNEIRIVYMSNLIKSKGYFDVLLAVDILVNNYGLKNIRCDFCGKFLDKDSQTNKLQFEEFIIENHLEDIVHFRGIVTGELKNQIINNSDIFVLPTYYETEGMPISILEALKARVVVISTKFRVIPEMIIDNQTGCFVESNRPDQIAYKIMELITNEKMFNSIRLNGYEHLRSNFSEEIFSKRVLGLFHSFQ
jgi:glycosyltransferase involved in cell wall biosynthesis